jgi:hypothetical protein
MLGSKGDLLGRIAVWGWQDGSEVRLEAVARIVWRTKFL